MQIRQQLVVSAEQLTHFKDTQHFTV